MASVILVTRLNGPVFGLNPDLIERADATPDTVVTLVDGTKYVIAESLVELMGLVREYRASVITTAHEAEQAARAAQEQPRRGQLVALPGREG
jgi:flagellar protein FlbD